jgi:molecular chaperone GrpE
VLDFVPDSPDIQANPFRNGRKTHTMSDANPPNGNPSSAAPDQATSTAAEPSTAELIAALEAEKADLKDKVLRTLAEMENLRRRTEREVADARTYGVTKFARDMLGVADNLRRALDSLPEQTRASLEGAAKGMVEGVELTEKELLKALETHGVRKLDPLGQKFDPNMHQAMFEAPDPTQAKGHVVAVVQSGFAIGDRVLRPALVGVSSGAPKAEPPADAAAQGDAA